MNVVDLYGGAKIKRFGVKVMGYMGAQYQARGRAWDVVRIIDQYAKNVFRGYSEHANLHLFSSTLKNHIVTTTHYKNMNLGGN